MKVKTLVTAVAAALYSVSMAQAAALSGGEVHKLQPLNITAEQAKQLNAGKTER